MFLNDFDLIFKYSINECYACLDNKKVYDLKELILNLVLLQYTCPYLQKAFSG